MPAIFHIGYHKTGSTFLQHHFFPRSKNKTYIGGDIAWGIVNPYLGKFDAASFRDAVVAQHGEDFLCSYESLVSDPLSGNFNALAMREYVRRIHEAFPDAKIVLFVREQTEIIQSMYTQYVKAGGTFSLPRVLRQDRSVHPFFAFEYYEYDRTLDIIQENTRPEQVFIYDFHELRDNGEQLLRRMSSDLDLGVADFSNLGGKSNVKFRLNSCRIARFLNHFTERQMKVKNYWVHIPYADRVTTRVLRFLDKYLPWNPKIKPNDFWTNSLRLDVLDRYVESNQRLLNRTGIDLAKRAA